MKGKHKKTLDQMLSKTTPAGIRWADIESLLISIGAEVREGNGSAVTFRLKSHLMAAHRPHPQKEAKRYQVRDALAFLKNCGVIDET